MKFAMALFLSCFTLQANALCVPVPGGRFEAYPKTETLPQNAWIMLEKSLDIFEPFKRESFDRKYKAYLLSKDD